MKTCHIADGGSDATTKVGLASDDCFGVASANSEGYQNSTASNACYIDAIVTPMEDIGLSGDALDTLPGCNPIQTIQPAVIHPPSSCGAATAASGGSAGASAPAETADSSTPATSAVASGAASAVVSEAVSSVPVAEKVAIVASSPAKSEAPASTATGTASTGSGSAGSGSSTGGFPNSIAVTSSKGSETWEYQGCYTDLIPDPNTRSLSHWGSGNSSTSCANDCFAAGYSIAGTEYGSQCFCGNSMTSTTKKADSDCDTACTGASSETCGGSSTMNVYAKSGTSLTKKKRAHVHRHAVKRRGSSF